MGEGFYIRELELVEQQVQALIRIESLSNCPQASEAYSSQPCSYRQWSSQPWSSQQWSRSAFTEELLSDFSCGFGAFKSDSLFGFIFIRIVERVGEITNFAVDPELRAQGMGRALLKAALVHAQLKSCEKVELEVRCSNVVAQSLYRKVGFEVVGRRPAYYRDARGCEDALLLTKYLP